MLQRSAALVVARRQGCWPLTLTMSVDQRIYEHIHEMPRRLRVRPHLVIPANGTVDPGPDLCRLATAKRRQFGQRGERHERCWEGVRVIELVREERR